MAPNFAFLTCFALICRASSVAGSSQAHPVYDKYYPSGPGRFTNAAHILSQHTLPSKSECVSQCHSNTSCYGISFNPTTNDCQLHAVSLADLRYSNMLDTSNSQYESMQRKMNLELATPYTLNLTNGFPSGSTVIIKGTPLTTASSFGVYFANRDMSIISFLFQARFTTAVYGPSIIRNALINGQWGVEERLEGTFAPFVRGAAVKLNITNLGDKFLVYINDIFFCTFNSRICPDVIQQLRIDGDGFVSDVQLMVNTRKCPALLRNIATAIGTTVTLSVTNCTNICGCNGTVPQPIGTNFTLGCVGADTKIAVYTDSGVQGWQDAGQGNEYLTLNCNSAGKWYINAFDVWRGSITTSGTVSASQSVKCMLWSTT